MADRPIQGSRYADTGIRIQITGNIDGGAGIYARLMRDLDLVSLIDIGFLGFNETKKELFKTRNRVWLSLDEAERALKALTVLVAAAKKAGYK